MTGEFDAPSSFRVERLGKVGSTNDEALARARAGDTGRLWVLAREQANGRGRHGRVWSSPKGNLYASLLLMDPSRPETAPQLGFVAGVALAGAVSEFLRHDRRLALKWPNDLLFGGAKLAGVLLEGSRLPDGRFACVVGVGVNCASHPAGLAYPAIHLSAVGRPVDPGEVFAALARRMEEQLKVWDGGRGFGRIRDSWLSFAAGVGEAVELRRSGERLAGVFQGLDAQGRMILATDERIMQIEAGDVFLTPPTRIEEPVAR